MLVNPYRDSEQIILTPPLRFFLPNSSLRQESSDITTSYVSTFKGNRFYPFNCEITEIDIEDIAHGLAYQCRFNGQTRKFFSVAEHSLIVSALLPPELKFAGLMHDMAEAYMGDRVKPLKVLSPELNDLEDQLTMVLAAHFGIDFTNYAPIKRADFISLATEKRDLMPNSTEDWSYLEGIPALAKPLTPMGPEEAMELFLDEFYRLAPVAAPAPRSLWRGP
jgi:hypothetical protein